MKRRSRQTLGLRAAKTEFSRLVDAAARGAEIITAKSGTPVARLGPFAIPEVQPKRRRLGSLAGHAFVPSDFDAPLPDALIGAFETG